MNFNGKKTIYFIFVFICLFVFIFSVGKLLFWSIDNSRANELRKQAEKEVKERPSQPEKTQNITPPQNQNDDYWDYIEMDMLDVNFDSLNEQNADTVGWLKLNGTNINYPVVQSYDNDYYLNHAYDKSKNSAGWIFADYRNDMNDLDKNTIIYGHGRLNNTMFGSLKNILNPEWYSNKENYIVKFSTQKYNTLWQVFSIYSVKAEDYYITTKFQSENDYNQFLTVIKNRSIKVFDTNLNSNDKIITLSTCKDTLGKERVVLHAKLIKIETR